MNTTLVKLIAICIVSAASMKNISASDTPVTPNLPDTVVIDFDAAHSHNNIVIRFSGGHQINITRSTDNSISLMAGDLNPVASSKLQNFIIYPGAGNGIRLTTDISSTTIGELMKKDEEMRKQRKEAEEKK